MPNSISYINSIKEIAHEYDLYLIDLWGVTHNGVKPFEDAIKIYEYLKNIGKTLVVISNAPRMKSIVSDRLNKLGVDPTLFDDIITSGGETHNFLKNLPNSFSQLKSFFHIGHNNDNSLYDGLSLIQTDTISDADFLLITNPFDMNDSTEDYISLLTTALELKKPAICGNADLTVYFGDKLIICAGAIAQKYKRLSEEKNINVPIIIFGKPNPSIFETAIKSAEIKKQKTFEKEKILMLGDSLLTDVLGAKQAGIKCVLTKSGIYQDWTDNSLTTYIHEQNLYPTYCIDKIK